MSRSRPRFDWFRVSVAVNLVLVTVAVLHPYSLLVLVAIGCAAAAGFGFGFAARGPAPNARSLAQRNRHLDRKLDATQAKLEREMTRHDER